jgi:hypothetical protein
MVEQQPERTCHITRMGEITPRFQIANVNDRFLTVMLNQRHLTTERLNGASVTLVRTDVIERTGNDNVQTIAGGILQAAQSGCDLAHTVGTEWTGGMRFADRRLFWTHPAVLGAGTGDMHPRAWRITAHRLQQVDRSLDIGAHGDNRRIPRLAGITLRRQVVHTIRRRPFYCTRDRVRIFDVSLVHRDPSKQMRNRACIAAPAFESVHLDAG